MQFAVSVRRRTREPGRERAFGKEERTAGVFAGGLDEDLRWASIMVLTLSGPVKHRIHGPQTLRRGFRIRPLRSVGGESAAT